MTKVKLCGLSRPADIEAANGCRPDFIGFVFAEKSKRYVTEDKARKLKGMLATGIQAVGVFVDAAPEKGAYLLTEGIIDIAQLHGSEDEEYIRRLRELTDKPIIKAFRVGSEEDLEKVRATEADMVLLDSGAGSGEVFDWSLAREVGRPYFLAGGLGIGNVREAAETLKPYAVDISSGIETDGVKDPEKMREFTALARSAGKEEKND